MVPPFTCPHKHTHTHIILSTRAIAIGDTLRDPNQPDPRAPYLGGASLAPGQSAGGKIPPRYIRFRRYGLGIEQRVHRGGLGERGMKPT